MVLVDRAVLTICCINIIANLSISAASGSPQQEVALKIEMVVAAHENNEHDMVLNKARYSTTQVENNSEHFRERI